MSSPTIFAGRRTKLLTTDGITLRSGVTIDYSGAVNVIENSSFEVSALPWASYQNTSQATPVTGAGGTPTVTIARSTAAPLYGQASGLFTKDANNRRGEGLSYTAVSPTGFQSQTLTVNFDTIMSVGYNGTTETVDVFVYDVTNAVLLTAVSAQRVATGASQFAASFTNSATSTSLRLAIHVSGAGTTAWTMKIDNVSLSKINIASIPATLLDSTTTVVNAADATKKLAFSNGGATTSTQTTITLSQTANRAFTLPDASGTAVVNPVPNSTSTLVTTNSSQILTNKELTSPLLELSLIKGTVKSLDVDAAAAFSIGASVGANNLTLGGASSTVVVLGTQTVAGAQTITGSQTLSSTQTVAGAATFNTNATVKSQLLLQSTAGAQAELQLFEAPVNGTNKSTIKAASNLAADYALTLPTTAGTVNQVLTTDGSGVLSWSTASSAPTPTLYTPTFTNFGAVTSISVRNWQNGKQLFVRGFFKIGSPAAAIAKMSLPAGFTIDGSIYASGKNILGLIFQTGSVASALPNGMLAVIYDAADATSVFFTFQGETTASNVVVASQNTNAAFNANANVAIDFSVFTT